MTSLCAGVQPSTRAQPPAAGLEQRRSGLSLPVREQRSGPSEHTAERAPRGLPAPRGRAASRAGDLAVPAGARGSDARALGVPAAAGLGTGGAEQSGDLPDPTRAA